MIIYLQDRRLQAADLLTKLQHVFGGFPLLFIGLRRITSGERDWPMAILEIAIAAVVLVTFVREVRQTLRPQEHGHSSAWHAAVGWFDLAAGGLLIFEAFHQPHVKPGYLRPPFLSGVVTIGIGLLHGRFRSWRDRRRYLKIDADGLQCRLSPFRRFRFAWSDLKSVEVAEKTIVFQPKEGPARTMRLRSYGNSDEIREAISNHAHAAGLLAGGEQKSLQSETADRDAQPTI